MNWSTVSAVCLVFLIGNITAVKHPNIIGGETAALKSFPYIVSLRYQRGQIGDDFCAGTIISDRHILTAAHCVEGKSIHALNVHAGTSRRDNPGNIFSIKSKKVHPTFNQRREAYGSDDIAVLTLEEPIVFNKHQQKINLPSHDIQNYEVGYVIGWGRSSATNTWERAKHLQKLLIALLPSEKCKPYLITSIDETQLCGVRGKGKSGCYGDSGGPLISHGEIVGIVSRGDTFECADGSPNIFTNVYSHKAFIEEAMKE